ncbi:MAG: hypothetical protein Q9227_003895 [Pyrenula ochraceoflavens]
MATTTKSPPTSPTSAHAKSKSASPARALIDDSQEIAEAAQQVEDGTVEVDSVHESDEGYDTDSQSTWSTSLSSSVKNYIHENGRRYHAFREGRYVFPNDDAEQDREDMKHTMVVNALGGKLHLAPIPQGARVIDLGTVGDTYPDATVLGVDFSPIQPPWVPPNVTFRVDDVESAWGEPPDYFDYIHARHMAPAFKDWKSVLKESFEHLKPGGWIEFQELECFPHCQDSSMTDEYIPKQYLSNVEKGLARLGVELNASRTVAEKLREAGFVNVTERIFNIPVGIWPRNKVLKTLGLYMREVVMSSLQGIALGGLHRGLGWSVQEVEAYLIGVRQGLMDHRVHSFFPYYVVYGQKPS